MPRLPVASDRFQYFSAWGAELHIPSSSAKQWIIPQSVQIIVAGILGLSSFFCEESPRYLCKEGKWDEAKETLGRLRKLPPNDGTVLLEISGIWDQLQNERGILNSKSWSWAIALKELLLVKSNQKRVLFVVSEQILAQWSGANSVTSKCTLKDHYTQS